MTGKTYTFFLPALYEKKQSVTFIIVPLKKLGDQHQESAMSLGLTAIMLEVQTINKEVIKVCSKNEFNQIIHFFFLKEIIKLQYQFVILGLDLIQGILLRTLWKNEAFIRSQLSSRLSTS